MPNYAGLGFELRDPHLQPAPNEYDAVRMSNAGRQERNVWPVPLGQSAGYFHPTPPAISSYRLGRTRINPQNLFVANLNMHRTAHNVKVPGWDSYAVVAQVFSTHCLAPSDEPLFFNGKAFQLDEIGPGEGRAYRIDYLNVAD